MITEDVVMNAFIIGYYTSFYSRDGKFINK